MSSSLLTRSPSASGRLSRDFRLLKLMAQDSIQFRSHYRVWRSVHWPRFKMVTAADGTTSRTAPRSATSARAIKRQEACPEADILHRRRRLDDAIFRPALAAYASGW